MNAAVKFDASEWIIDYIGVHLDDDTKSTVQNFTMMWNIFEEFLCKNSANVPEFVKVAEKFDPEKVSPETLQKLQDCLLFWGFRYRTPDGFSDRFLSLDFRRNDRQDLVEAVLLGREVDPKQKFLALMIIVYRLRNNLFHGKKSIHMLNFQAENLNVASICLSAFIESISIYE